ncbi:MAG: hypothetical protein RR882_09900, partial [Comamonas sp.]
REFFISLACQTGDRKPEAETCSHAPCTESLHRFLFCRLCGCGLLRSSGFEQFFAVVQRPVFIKFFFNLTEWGG